MHILNKKAHLQIISTEIISEIENNEWKEKDKQYLKELQRFLDITDNIKDNDLRMRIINQMIKCESILTKLAKKRFEEFYKKGIIQSKKI